MNQVLIPILLLATAAVSSSNVLPFFSPNHLQHQAFSLKGQQKDNIFSNRQYSRSLLNDVLYKIPNEASDDDQTELNNVIYNIDAENNQAEDKYNIINKNEKYNGDGFRQEQWHNYPRQLDRLHNYLYEQYNVDKRKLDPGDPGNAEDNPHDSPYRNLNAITNEFRVDTDADAHNIYDAFVATTNPLLIFKIRLACLNNDIGDTEANQFLNDYPTSMEEFSKELQPENEGDEKSAYQINPVLDVIKVKRKSSDKLNDSGLANTKSVESKPVTKRIFSLWSRLQSLNHRGHELLHRRHLHAFYGMPDNDGNGVLTAETRATLLRPPGSPLRWG